MAMVASWWYNDPDLLNGVAVPMAKKLTIELTDADAERLSAEAARLGVSPEDLARAVVSDVLTERNEAFGQAMDHVLRKNADLYKRLS